MVQDVVELRDNNWVPRRIVVKPQRLDDVHREHAKEEQEEMEVTVASSSSESNLSKFLRYEGQCSLPG